MKSPLELVLVLVLMLVFVFLAPLHWLLTTQTAKIKAERATYKQTNGDIEINLKIEFLVRKSFRRVVKHKG
jgi:uncharacterized protein (DUF58 family)